MAGNVIVNTNPMTRRMRERFASQFSFNYTALFAAVTIAVIPSIIVFAIFQEQVVSSLTAGSVKE